MKWFWYASPQTFFPLAGKLARAFGAAAALLAAIGLSIGLFVAPTDAQQGEAYRIIYIHVPAAWMSMFIYLVMAGYAALTLSLNARLPAMMASALAPTGALFTFIALWTGSLWGKPTWGTWWVWDARLTSELILLFLYFGFIPLAAPIDQRRRADPAGPVAAVAGGVNIPLTYEPWRRGHRRHGGARQPEAPGRGSALRRHRHRKIDAGRLSRPAARPLQRGQGRGGARPARRRRRVHGARGACQARRELHAARGGARARAGRQGTENHQ